MKRTLAALAIAGIALAGCSAGKPQAQAPSTTAAPTTTEYHAPPTTVYHPPTTTTTAPPSHLSYYARVRGVFPASSDAALLDLGMKACAAIDEAGSITAYAPVADAQMRRGEFGVATMHDVAVVVDAAVREFCPEYLPELNAIQG